MASLTSDQLQANFFSAICAYIKKQDNTQTSCGIKPNIQLKKSAGAGIIISKWNFPSITQPTNDQICAALTMTDVTNENVCQYCDFKRADPLKLLQGIFQQIQTTTPTAFSSQTFEQWAYSYGNS